VASAPQLKMSTASLELLGDPQSDLVSGTFSKTMASCLPVCGEVNLDATLRTAQLWHVLASFEESLNPSRKALSRIQSGEVRG
jgi:hypothetical protein